MVRKLFLLIIVLTVVSCQKRVWDNPFDPGCPKELFTPKSLTATQSGNNIVITWVQDNTKISGYKVYRNATDGSFSEVATLSSQLKTWTHTNPTGGIKYGYKVVTTAGSNLSNEAIQYKTVYFQSTLTTVAPSSITSSSAVSGGNIPSDGGASITAKGVCWGILPSPTIMLNSYTTDGTGSGTFTSNITGLSPGTKYYVRAYATNSVGTSYGDEVSFNSLAILSTISTTTLSSYEETVATCNVQ